MLQRKKKASAHDTQTLFWSTTNTVLTCSSFDTPCQNTSKHTLTSKGLYGVCTHSCLCTSSRADGLLQSFCPFRKPCKHAVSKATSGRHGYLASRGLEGKGRSFHREWGMKDLKFFTLMVPPEMDYCMTWNAVHLSTGMKQRVIGHVLCPDRWSFLPMRHINMATLCIHSVGFCVFALLNLCCLNSKCSLRELKIANL